MRKKGPMTNLMIFASIVVKTWCALRSMRRWAMLSLPRAVRTVINAFIVILLGSGGVLAQGFGATAGVSDLPFVGCNASTGLLPQLNPPAAVTSCSFFTAGASMNESAGAYPSNGMLATSALVNSAPFGSLPSNYGLSSAVASFFDTYTPQHIPPNAILVGGGILVTVHVSGNDSLVCAPPPGLTSCSDYAHSEADFYPVGSGIVRLLDGTVPTSSIPGRTYMEFFLVDSGPCDTCGVGQDIQFFAPWDAPASPNQGVTVQITLKSNAQCEGFDPSQCTAWSFMGSTLQVTHADVVDASGNIIPGATVATASGFDPNASQQLALTNFIGKLDITIGPPSSFDFSGSFTLGSGSTGINPPVTGLTLTVGAFSVVVPANSFVQKSKGVFVFEGTIDGLPLQVRIAPTTTTNIYSLKVEASGMNLSSTTNPVPIKLVMGVNVGSTEVTAQLQ